MEPDRERDRTREASALRGGAVGTLLALGIFAFSCGGSEPVGEPGLLPPYESPAGDAGERCLDCHGEIVEAWRASPMARALSPVRAEEFAAAGALGGVMVREGGFRYDFENLPEGPAVVETRASRPSHRIVAPLAFAIGAGVRDRSFAAVRGAFLWFSPLEILTVREDAHPVGRRAVLAPGHMLSPDARFGTPITSDCLGCHTDQPPPPAFPGNLLPDATEFWPSGLSCAACHRGTSSHADWQERDLVGEEVGGPDPILSRDQLDRYRALSICAACHLQGDARIPLDGGGIGPPEPGGDLLDKRAVFVAADPGRGVGFVSQVERLVLSPCFLGSDEMTCTSCHDPHRALDAPGGRAEVRASCERCHPRGRGKPTDCARYEARDPADTPDMGAADCVDCHMPVTPVFDIAEVSVHDHFIRSPSEKPVALRRTDPTPRIFEAPDGDWKRFGWPNRPEPPGAEDPGLWMAAFAQARLGVPALERYRQGMGTLSNSIPIVQHLAGVLLGEAGLPAEAEEAYRRALALNDDLSESAINLALLLGEGGRLEEGLALLDRVLDRHPSAVGALRNRATLRLDQGDLSGFASDLERAFELDPREELARALATLSERTGRHQEARSWASRADALSGK